MEIEKRLSDRRYDPKAIKKVLEYLKEIGYINDESYAESFIRSTKDVTGTSRRSIYQKLAAKGVDKEIIQQELDKAEIDDYASALSAAKKKISSLKGSSREKKLRLLNYLYRKGFGIDACKRAAEELVREED